LKHQIIQPSVGFTHGYSDNALFRAKIQSSNDFFCYTMPILILFYTKGKNSNKQRIGVFLFSMKLK